jgi:hypothetical protein
MESAEIVARNPDIEANTMNIDERKRRITVNLKYG